MHLLLTQPATPRVAHLEPATDAWTVYLTHAGCQLHRLRALDMARCTMAATWLPLLCWLQHRLVVRPDRLFRHSMWVRLLNVSAS
jgi:hypothetical protein